MDALKLQVSSLMPFLPIDNRVSTAEFIVPPHTSGPPAHWHEMHDEQFLVTKGTIRFHVPEAPGLEAKDIDAKEGDFVVVPTRAPHTFSNPTGEEARFINTFTPVSRDMQSCYCPKLERQNHAYWYRSYSSLTRPSTSITSSYSPSLLPEERRWIQRRICKLCRIMPPFPCARQHNFCDGK